MKKYLILIIPYVYILGCTDENHILQTHEVQCLNSFEVELKNKNISKINFNEVVTCFDWDYLSIKSSGAYTEKEFRNIKYKTIGNWSVDLIDGDKNWSYIYFYNKSNVCDYAIAIHEKHLNLDSLLYRFENIKRQNSTIKISRPNAKRYYTNSMGRDTLYVRYAVMSPANFE